MFEQECGCNIRVHKITAVAAAEQTEKRLTGGTAAFGVAERHESRNALSAAKLLFVQTFRGKP